MAKTLPRTDGPLIDTHVHIFRSNTPLLPGMKDVPQYEFTAEQLEDKLDAHGVQGCVIAAASYWGDCNDYVIQSVRERPMWRGTVILEPTVDRYTLEQMAGDGIVGVRLPFIGMPQLPDLGSWDYRKFLYRLADLNWHVHLHLDGQRLPLVLPQLENAGVKIVLDHLGRPDPALGADSEGFRAMVRSIEKGRTWAKVSGQPRLGPKATQTAQALLRAVGFERLVWGSDCPFVGVESTTYEDTLAWLAQLVPDAQQRHRIGAGNAIELYYS